MVKRFSSGLYQRKSLQMLLVLSILQLGILPVSGQPGPKPVFRVITLGNAGGLDESRLTAFAISARDTNQFIAMDAGNLRAGAIRLFDKKTKWTESWPSSDVFLRSGIQAYFITHAHFDHIAGLVINAPNDSAKPIYGLPKTIEDLQTHVFNWRLWPNFGDGGPAPQLKKYHLQALQPGLEVQVGGLFITAYPLDHGAPYGSTAFLVQHPHGALAYLGDTGPDAVEKGQKLAALWRVLAPEIAKKRLRGLFMEVSYPDPRAENLLFGHLTPMWLMREMKALKSAVTAYDADLADPLQGLNLVITHIKPDRGAQSADTIRQQLQADNPLGLKLHIPTSGDVLEL